MTFVHAVVTRVGIGVYDESWFDWRLGLLEAITAPSMTAQTSQEYTWLLVVDRECPEAARERIDRIAEGRAEVLEVEFKTDLQATVGAWLAAHGQDADQLLSTRLDDDDALHVRAMELIHEAAHEQRSSDAEFGIVSFGLGTMWLPSARRGYTRYHESLGLGLTLIESSNDTPETVWSRKHLEIKYMLAPRGTYFREYAGATKWWLYTTHNLASSDTGDAKRARKILAHRYGYYVDDDMLSTFGLDPSTIDKLAGPEPASVAPLRGQWTRAMKLEHEIRSTRETLSETRGWRQRRELQRRLRELELRRREAGTDLVDAHAAEAEEVMPTQGA